MRLPYLQVTAETWELADALAGLMGIDDGKAFKALCDVWRWGLGLGPAEQPPEGVCDSPRADRLLAAACRWPQERAAELVEALDDLGVVEVLSGGRLRVKGLDRYHGAWAKNRRRGHGRDPRNDSEPAPEENPGGTRAGPGRVQSGPHVGPGRQTQTQTQTQKKEQLPLSAQAAPEADPRPVKVFEHWRRVMGKNARTVFDAKRLKAVEGRLREGYTVEELCQAVDGCALTPHNMGQNDRGERYDDLELICRDASRVDRFRARAGQAGGSARPSRDDLEAFEAAARIAAPMHAQLVPMLAELRWQRVGDRLVGRTTDPFRVEWFAENWPELAVAGVRVELEVGVEQREAAA